MASAIIIILLITIFGAITNGLSSKSVWEDSEIVPDVIPVAPAELLQVTYADDIEVDQGNELTPTEVKTAPNVIWDADEDSYYTLIMTDPDAPGREEPILREWQHWIVGNIPGNDVSSGDTIASYMAIGPPLGSGLHRYPFLVWKQAEKITFDEPVLGNSCKGRGLFSTADFAEKYSLGDPIAGNFYVGQYDDYSPILQKEIGMKIIKFGNITKYLCVGT